MKSDLLLVKIRIIIVKLDSLLLSAKLRQLTNMRPKIRNIARWSSSYKMVGRNLRLEDVFPETNSGEIDVVTFTF